MFLELIGTVFAGLAMAGVMMLVNRVTGGRLPRWTVPVAAGLAMLAATISSEYSWFSRTSASLPSEIVIAQTVERQAIYQPWTYLVPYIHRFVAVDGASVRENPQVPDQRLADVYFFGRWSPVNKIPVLADCATGRRASLVDGAEFGADGAITNAEWIAVGGDDPLLSTLCAVS